MSLCELFVQVSTCQPLLQEQAQQLLVKLFESSHEEVDVLVQVGAPLRPSYLELLS